MLSWEKVMTRTIVMAVALNLLFSVAALALSEKEYGVLLRNSAEFREADAMLNSTWKKISRGLKKEDKQFLLKMHREWLGNGRDEEARSYMEMGYKRDCAYAKATRKWVKSLEVFDYNVHLPPDEAGRAKADDAFWDEDDEDIPPHCRAK